ncbi:M23 family peptidase [Rhodococcus sp. 15-1154-1]|nr:M23 family peptidase [Rhodococcus sp. 15-1154-1]
MNSVESTEPTKQSRSSYGARASAIVSVVIGAALAVSPSAAADPQQTVPGQGPGNADSAETNRQTVDALDRLLRLAERAATIGTDPIALSDLTSFASSSLETARSNGILADTAGPVSSSLNCVVDVIARGSAASPAQSISCLAPVAAIDPLLGIRILSSLQVGELDPAVPHDGYRSGERDQSFSAGADQATVPDAAASPLPGSEAGEGPPRGSGTEPSRSPNAASAIAPSAGIVTSSFGARGGAQHGGVDIADSLGSPIVAAADGTVISAGPAQGFGLWVRIRHDDGSITTYGHNNGNSVTVGQRVRKGDQIAEVGNRGNSTGPHLHFEATSPAGQKVDPEAWLSERGAKVGAGRIAR